MTFAFYKRTAVLVAASTMICFHPAQAQIAFVSPAESSSLAKSTVLSGTCTGSKHVVLNGPGIAKNKTISCQKNDKHSRFWSYSLENAYKEMPDGSIPVTASQGGQHAQRTFVKGSSTAGTKPAKCYLNGHNIDSGKTIKAYRARTVTSGQSCISEIRICTNGSLSGSYAYASCTVASAATPAPAPSPIAPPTPPAPTPTPVPTPAPSDPAPADSGPSPQKAPGQNFDLSVWKLTLPVDGSGQFSGVAVEVKPLASTYQNALYFYSAADGAMTFMAPTEGATTSGSHYPRSELRELTSSGANAAWTVEQGGSLSATLAVNEVPLATTGKNGRVVIGQIHGPNDELCRLYYDNGQLYFYDDKSGANQNELQYILKSSTGATTSIPLNAPFDYTIVVANGSLVVSARHGGTTYSATEPITSFWRGQALYFKAGVYVQVGKPGSGAGTVGTGRGKVSFYKLAKPSHP